MPPSVNLGGHVSLCPQPVNTSTYKFNVVCGGGWARMPPSVNLRGDVSLCPQPINTSTYKIAASVTPLVEKEMLFIGIQMEDQV